MKKIAYIILLSINLFPIGFDGFYIPSNPRELSLSSTGVASRNNIFLSSANKINQSEVIGFCINRWIQDLQGNSIYLRKNNYQFSFSSIGTNEIELRDNVPSDEPLSMIGAHLLSVEVSRYFLLSNQISIGVGSNLNYHKLFRDKSTSSTLHIGSKFLLSEKISLAQTVKNISSNKDIPALYTLGLSYYQPKTKTEILLDCKYSDEYKMGFHFGVSQAIGGLAFNYGYSKYENYKTTMSGGFNFKISNSARFLYSILSIQKSNLGIAHSFGVEFSL